MPFGHGCAAQAFKSISHCAPVNLAGHWQVNGTVAVSSVGPNPSTPPSALLALLGMHWPPFRHGEPKHGPSERSSHPMAALNSRMPGWVLGNSKPSNAIRPMQPICKKLKLIKLMIKMENLCGLKKSNYIKMFGLFLKFN